MFQWETDRMIDPKRFRPLSYFTGLDTIDSIQKDSIQYDERNLRRFTARTMQSFKLKAHVL